MTTSTVSASRRLISVVLGLALLAASALPYASVSADGTEVLSSQTIIAEADAYVQDGSFSGDNFGAATTLFAKLDVTSGFNREAFVRFDLSGVTEPIVEAKLRLSPVTVDLDSFFNLTRLVADDSWDETLLTWDTRPASSQLLGRWSPVAAVDVEVDVTTQVRAEAAGDGKISFLVASEADVGPLGTVEYGSRELVGSEPELVVTTTGSVESSGLAVSLAATASAPLGDQLNYDAAVANEGPSDAHGVVLSVTVPADVSISSVTASQGSGCSFDGQVASCAIDDLSFGAAATMLVETIVLNTATGSIQAQASAWSRHTDADPTDDDAVAATTISGAAFQAVDFVTGLNQPTSMAFAPDGRLFVTEKGGQLRVIKDGVLLPTPFVTVSAITFIEEGLLGVAFPPNFDTTGHVYVYYTTTGEVNRISRFTTSLAGDGDTADPNSEEVIFEVNVSSFGGAHNGGAIHFGPDGMLYVGVGDHAVPANAQDPNIPAGAILRLDAMNAPNIVPSDGLNLSGEVYSGGLRNPYTFAIDAVTGRILINDVGKADWEEVNSGQVGTPGLNYGWATCEGFCNSGFTNPVAAFPHPISQAVTGGVFSRGAALPSAYEGHYLVSDYLQGWMYRITPDNRVYGFMTGLDSPLDIDVAPDGKLYHISFTSNKIVEIVFTGSLNRAPTAVASAMPTNGFATLAVTFDASGSSDPDLDALSYEWDFGDGSPVSNLQTVVHSYTSNGTFIATLTVDDGNGGSDTDTIVITVGSTPPTATIDLPLVASTYSGGDTIAYSGTATDPEDGPLGASAFRWTIQFWHNDGFAHFHPYLGPIDAVTSGTFDAATVGETSPNVWYRVILEVTDSSGLTDTTFVDVSPITAQVTLDTVPTGLEVLLDSSPQTAPHVFTGVAGVTRNIGTTTTQTPAATTYTFLGWSDAGALSHDITTPSVDATFTASFNSAPVAQDLALNLNEDSFIDVTLSALDGETCELAFSVVTGPTSGVLGAITNQACISGSPNTDTATVTYTPNPDFTGADSFTYMGNDGTQDSAPATVTLTVDSITPPGTAFRMNVNGPDYTTADGRLFSSEQPFSPGSYGYIGSSVTRAFSGTIAGTTDDALYLTVRGSNSATLQLDFDGLAPGDYDVTLYFFAPTGDNPGDRVFDVQAEGTTVLDDFDIWTAAGASMTAHMETFTASVTDGRLDIDLMPGSRHAIISAVEVVSTAPALPNDPPAITSPPLTSATEDVLYTYDVDATDPDAGDTLTYALDAAPAGMTIDSSTGVIAWTPGNVDVGSHAVTARVTDAGGLFDTQTYTLDVANTNDPPTITSSPVTSASEDVLYTYDVDATDPDAGDTLTYSLDAAPAGMTIDLTTGVIAWTPTSAELGGHNVTARVEDLAGLFDTQAFTVDVGSASPALAFRVNAGGPSYTTLDGRTFVADQAFAAGSYGYIGGVTRTFAGDVAGTDDDALFLPVRGHSSTTVQYDFDGLPAGDYDVTLYFFALNGDDPGERVFDVLIEGVIVLDDFDIRAASGATLTAYTQTFTVTVADGMLDIDIVPGSLAAPVSAVEVTQAP